MFSKKIVAAAALLALAAGAQAQVKVYGQLDMSVGSFKTPGQAKSVTGVESGVMSTGSYIGFSGKEDLGGGLTAGFVLESYVSGDTGASSTPFWGRASNVYLKGAFGKVALGQSDTPVYTATAAYSPFGDSQVFAPAQVALFGSGIAASAATPGLTNFSNGTSELNSITYDTPDMAGLSATVQFGAKESATAGNKNNTGLGVSYNAGPLSAMVAYGKTGANPLSTQADLKTTIIGASYDFGVVKGFAQYFNVKNVGGTPSTAKATGYTLGASIPVSASGTAMVAYGSGKIKPTTPTQKASMFSVGYEHSLSKRTSVYVAANHVKTKNVVATAVENGRNYAVGIKHNF